VVVVVVVLLLLLLLLLWVLCDSRVLRVRFCD